MLQLGLGFERRRFERFTEEKEFFVGGVSVGKRRWMERFTEETKGVQPGDGSVLWNSDGSRVSSKTRRIFKVVFHF